MKNFLIIMPPPIFYIFFFVIGQIELFYDRGNHHEFLSQLKELARHGDLIKNTSYPFEFSNVEKPYEVYTGSNVRLRYVMTSYHHKIYK